MAVLRAARARLSDDAVVRRLLAEAAEDPETVGLVLTGSRAAGAPDARSDYDAVRVLAASAADRGGRQVKEGPTDVTFQTLARLERLADEEHWARATFIGARILLDRTGELPSLLERLVTYPPDAAHRIAFDAYDGYLNGFVRSLRAWQKDDELGARLQAGESLTHLVKALFALEGRVAPYLDRLRTETLAPLARQGWSAAELERALLDVARTAAPDRQQALQRRVEALMEERGVRAHADWGEQLERLKTARF